MKLGTQTIWVGGLAILLAAAASHASAQQGVPDAPQAQQGVPNAPQPQTLPRLNSITPVAAALPTTPSQAGASTSTDTPAAPAEAQTPAEDQDQGRRRSRSGALRTR